MKMIKENLLWFNKQKHATHSMKQIYQTYQKQESRIEKVSRIIDTYGITYPRDGLPLYNESNNLTLRLNYITIQCRIELLADYITKKLPKLVYLDISSNMMHSNSKGFIEHLKRILDQPSIIFVNVFNNYIYMEDISCLNEYQLRKLIWLDGYDLNPLSNTCGSWHRLSHNNSWHDPPTPLACNEDEIKYWHRRLYKVINRYRIKVESEGHCYGYYDKSHIASIKKLIG
jgi:hypothetical protein